MLEFSDLNNILDWIFDYRNKIASSVYRAFCYLKVSTKARIPDQVSIFKQAKINFM